MQQPAQQAPLLAAVVAEPVVPQVAPVALAAAVAAAVTVPMAAVVVLAAAVAAAEMARPAALAVSPEETRALGPMARVEPDWAAPSSCLAEL
jgi:hypothetical protein